MQSLLDCCYVEMERSQLGIHFVVKFCYQQTRLFLDLSRNMRQAKLYQLFPES